MNPGGDVWAHHLKVSDERELDDEVQAWMAEAFHVARREPPRRRS